MRFYIMVQSFGVTDAEAKGMLEAFDTNQDGAIDYQGPYSGLSLCFGVLVIRHVLQVCCIYA